MYQQMSYNEYVEKYPNQPFTKALIKIFSAKPDFTELDKASKECEESMKAELEKQYKTKASKATKKL